MDNFSGSPSQNTRSKRKAETSPADNTRSKKKKGNDKQRTIPPMERIWKEATKRKHGQLNEGASTFTQERVRNYPELARDSESCREDDQGLHESANPDQSKHSVRSLDLSKHPQETHYSTRDTMDKRLEDFISKIIENKYMPFLVEFEEKYEEPIKAMMKSIESIRDMVANQAIPDANIETNMEKEEKAEVDKMFWKDGVADNNIPSKIEHLKGIISNYKDKSSQSEITDERREELDRKSKLVGKYIDYLNLWQEQLQKQYEKIYKAVTEYKKKRRELSTLKRQSGQYNEDLQNFQDGLSLKNDTKRLLWDRAMERYKVEHSDAVSLLVLDGSNKLVEQFNELETTLDKKIARMQELQKRAVEDLGSHKEDCDDHYFLKSQKHETDYYSEHEDLVCLQQARGMECGIICTQMVAAGHNTDYSAKWDKVEKMLESFEHFYSKSIRGNVPPIIYPIVLKQIGYPVKYQYCGNEPASLIRQRYLSYMGHEPQPITVDQLRNVIEGGKGPIIMVILRNREDKDRRSALYYRAHAILIDAMETRNGEEHILYRDPWFGKGFCVSWKDFLEVCDGRACIPVGE